MKVTSTGYDPTLGQRFSDESSGLVIGRARSLPQKSEEQVIQEYVDEHGRAPDVQQLFDAMQESSSPHPETKESLQARWARMTPQQLGELYDKLM